MRTWTEYKNTFRQEDPIYDLARTGELEMLRTLDLGGGRIDRPNAKGYAPLMLAAYHGHHAVVQYLLDKGADPNTADAGGSSVLMGAAFKGDLAMVRLLVRAGARADARNHRNQTALDFANMFGRAGVSRFLRGLESFTLRDVLAGWASFLFARKEKSS